MSDFPEQYGKAIRYGHSDAANLLEQLRVSAAEREPGSLLRGVTADALDEIDRSEEAAVLRSGQEVAIHKGQVKRHSAELDHLANHNSHALDADGHRLYRPDRTEMARHLAELGRHTEAQLLLSRHPIRYYDGGFSSGYLPFADGGYPIVHDGGGVSLCADCANHAVEEWAKERAAGEHHYPSPHIDHDAYFEGPPIQCDGCDKEIESAYGDPDDNHKED